jgi:hypothetical protein
VLGIPGAGRQRATESLDDPVLNPVGQQRPHRLGGPHGRIEQGLRPPPSGS